MISRFTRGYEVVAADIADSEVDSKLNRYFYTVDEQGSTVLITDKNQNVRNEYYYDAFGNVLDLKENIHNRITYTGQQFDGITGQYYLRARFYNPVIGRFAQEDVYRGDGLNLYAYCANNPVRYWDPSGYERCPEGNSKERNISKETPKNEIKIGKSDLDEYREELGVPERHTIAVGKTDIDELANHTFKGASPQVRKEAGLPDLDEVFPNREIKAPYDENRRGHIQFMKHAEEGVMAEFEDAVNKAGITSENVKGTLYIHQSNPDGVCNKCTKGLFKSVPYEERGIFKQLTDKYPNLTIKVSTEIDPNLKNPRDTLSFDVRNGIARNVVQIRKAKK
ncbi:RHS repeat-associated core domain-containing protein [Clostridium sp.]|uniref:RHS repeat-associated core domain-containing protein n=1 Tax=Clostridium sp. TaxID=1506 RepID=UPI002635CC83|nr:RHS repeat-associated core domain-containing protein [Clostridium sp.]